MWINHLEHRLEASPGMLATLNFQRSLCHAEPYQGTLRIAMCNAASAPLPSQRIDRMEGR